MNIVERLLADRPSFHAGGTVRWNSMPETLRMIAKSVRDGSRTLETGSGASTVVFAACGAHHTAISPDGREHERVREYCRSIGVDDSRLTFIAGFSDQELPALCKERVFDAAYIDGAHEFPYPEVDWHFVSRALKIGGVLLMDDVPIPAVAPVFRHMRLEPQWRFEGILDHRAAAFTLVRDATFEEQVSQAFNAGVPDYSFEPLPTRLAMTAGFRLAEWRSSLGTRYPRLRALWKRSRTDGGR